MFNTKSKGRLLCTNIEILNRDRVLQYFLASKITPVFKEFFFLYLKTEKQVSGKPLRQRHVGTGSVPGQCNAQGLLISDWKELTSPQLFDDAVF